MLKFGSISCPFRCQLKKLASNAMHVNTTGCVLGQTAAPDVTSTELVRVIEGALDPIQVKYALTKKQQQNNNLML